MNEFIFDELIFEDQIFLDFEASNQRDLIEKLSLYLENKGFVLPGYAENVLLREADYPTGLPTNIMKVAIPHAIESTTVVTPSIVIVKLKEPVEFGEMGSLENKVDVDLVMLLAVKGDKSQLIILQKLISIFSDEDSMEKLKSANNSSQVYNLFRELVRN